MANRCDKFRDNPAQFGVLLCVCGKRAYSSERTAAKGLALAQSRRVLEEKRVYECNWVPGTWHLTSSEVEDAPKLLLPPSPPSGGDRPQVDVIADLLVAAVQEQGPGLLMPSFSAIRRHFSLDHAKFGSLKKQLVRSKWIRAYETSPGHFTTWPRQYAEEHGPRVVAPER